MNTHEFIHEMTQVHASVKRVLERLPTELFKSERQELVSIKRAIENFIITPEDVLTEKEK